MAPLFTTNIYEKYRTYFWTASAHSTCHHGSARHLFPALLPRVNAAEVAENTAMSHMAKPKTLVSDMDIQDYLAKETGEDRLRAMFSKTEKGQLNPELELVVKTTKSVGFLTLFLTAILGGKQAKDDFIRRNQHTKFSTKFRALRAHQDAIFIGGMKYGAKWGLRTAGFTFIFLSTSQMISVYRNKSSILEYTAAGLVTGSVLRVNLGLKGMFAGGIIGSVFGTLGGILMWGSMKMAGETQEERHYWTVHEELRMTKEAQQFSSGSSSPASELLSVN